MGANEIANRVEATCWIATGQVDNPEGPIPTVEADQFFFRSLVGFVDTIDVISPDQTGIDWATVDSVTLGLTLEREYNPRSVSLFGQPVDSWRNDADGNVQGLGYNGPVRIVPLSDEGYEAVVNGAPLPTDAVDMFTPFRRLLVILDLDYATDAQVGGFGGEFCIELLSMQQNEDGETSVNFPVAP